jgi:AcrR family transcriptional regulator
LRTDTEQAAATPEAAADGPRTQAERAAQSDKALIDAAVELILERGTEGTTLQAIGEQAGYSRGLATYRYGSKAGLFREVSRTIHKRWVGYLNAAVAGLTGIDALCAAADAYYRFVSDRPREIRVLHILYYEGAGPRSDLRGLAREAFERQLADVQAWLEDGIRRGLVVEDIDPGIVATQYVSHIAGITYMWLLNPDGIDFRAIHLDYKRQLRERLAAPAGGTILSGPAGGQQT